MSQSAAASAMQQGDICLPGTAMMLIDHTRMSARAASSDMGPLSVCQRARHGAALILLITLLIALHIVCVLMCVSL